MRLIKRLDKSLTRFLEKHPYRALIFVYNHGITLYFIFLTAGTVWCMAILFHQANQLEKSQNDIVQLRDDDQVLVQRTAVDLCKLYNRAVRAAYKQDLAFWRSIKANSLRSAALTRQIDIPGLTDEDLDRLEKNTKQLLRELRPKAPEFQVCPELPLIEEGEKVNGN